MATMADVDELALALPQATKEVSDDGTRAQKRVAKAWFAEHEPEALD